MPAASPALPAAPDDDAADRAVARARRRLLPLLFLLYVVSYLDRVNVGFAALEMNRDLGFSPAVYGLGAGVFFLGYFLCEVPSNLALARVGARRWLARILVSWGVVSSAMALVRGAGSFYALRFLLGVAEAGFFPGVVLYLTYWFPDADRARAIALFMTATAVAGVVGGPVSGALLGLHGLGGLAGWHWLFLLEGVPAIVLGVVVWRRLPDGPRDAAWLPADERDALLARLAAERRGRGAASHTVRAAFASRAVWLLAAVYFAIVFGFYGVAFWLPQLIAVLGVRDDLVIGLLTAVPYLAAAAAMVVVARSSDRRGERQWHVAVPAFVGAAGLALGATVDAPLPWLVAITVAAAGIWGALGPFWTLPTAVLDGAGAAAGIAIVNSVGNLGGFVGPWAVGLARAASNGFAYALALLATVVACAAALVLVLPRAPRARRPA
jgi:ACS family tartrate transporter-like MFS transporter